MDSQDLPQTTPLDTPPTTRLFASFVPPPLSQPSLSTSSSTTTASDSSLEEPLQNLSLESPHYHSKLQPNYLGQSSEAHDNLNPTPDHHEQQAPYSPQVISTASNPQTTSQMTQHDSAPQNNSRPILHHQTSSYSKRHASFDTPREVPLPYMPSRAEEGARPQFSSASSSHAQPSSPSGLSFVQGDEQVGKASVGTQKADAYTHCELRAGSTFNGPSNGTSSSAGLSAAPPPYSAATQEGFHSSQPSTPCYMDMMDVDESENYLLSSHHSQQSPPHSQCQQRSIFGPVSLFSRPFSSPDASRIGAVSPRIYSSAPIQASEVPDRNSTASLPLPTHTPYHTLPSLTGSTIHEGREMGNTTEQYTSSQPQAGPSHTQHCQTYNRRQPPYARPTSPNSAYSPSRFSRSHFHRRDWYHENDSEPFQDHALSSESPSTSAPYVATALRDHRSLTSSPSMPSGPMPPLAPPVILTPPPPPSGEQSDGSNASGPVPPHVSFLSHGPLSRDVYIAVETLVREYRLIVRLPGYRRDSITLSTRKRRILHLVADSWEPEGGHFERRISFGYDADLAQVRAEFDGELLQVIVPRKVAPMTYWSSRD